MLKVIYIYNTYIHVHDTYYITIHIHTQYIHNTYTTHTHIDTKTAYVI